MEENPRVLDLHHGGSGEGAVMCRLEYSVTQLPIGPN